MKIFSDREFRNEPGKIRKELEKHEVVMTSRGKPYAVLLPVDDPSNVEEVLELAARIRAQMALSSVRQKASKKGLDNMPSSEIDDEIKAVRKQRQR
ncbi:MAG: type II toxin-antitoxin system Phd/YefM family antitoxin [Desulfohalobiaceae bacterium]|nr:type II toxin-antitoxin system Phd/YefM family antitoxin [Desulfohalobiaceae bacterium]